MRKIESYISKSKLILREWNAFYFSEIAFIYFMLHEIKQCIVFLGHPVYIYTIYKMSGRSLSVYKDTSASHEYLCTLIKNGHEFCKLLLKRT